METAVEVSYGVAEMFIGPDSLVPWWAWLAPLAMIFLKLLTPVLLPEVAEAEMTPATTEEKKGKGKNGKKDKKPKKKK